MKFKEDIESFSNALDISKLLILIKKLRKDVDKLQDHYANNQEQEIEAKEDSKEANEEDDKEDNKEDYDSNEIVMKQLVDDEFKENSDLSSLDYNEANRKKATKLKRYNNTQRILSNDEKSRYYIRDEIKTINNIVSREIEQIEEEKKSQRGDELSRDFKLSSENEDLFNED